MSFEAVRQLADAVLLEGYVLYPYRVTSKKNQFRWSFGVVAPRAWSEADGCEPWWLEADCLIESERACQLAGSVRFMQAQSRRVERQDGATGQFVPAASLEVGGTLHVPWNEGEVRECEFFSHLRTEAPLPERVVEGEIRARGDSLEQQLAANGLTLDSYLASQGETQEQHETHVKADVERDLRTQFILDAITAKEELTIEEAELSEYIVRRASRLGVSPDDYASQLVRSGTVPLAVADVLRSKALAQVLERAAITDASGRAVDLKQLEADAAAAAE